MYGRSVVVARGEHMVAGDKVISYADKSFWDCQAHELVEMSEFSCDEIPKDSIVYCDERDEVDLVMRAARCAGCKVEVKCLQDCHILESDFAVYVPVFRAGCGLPRIPPSVKAFSPAAHAMERLRNSVVKLVVIDLVSAPPVSKRESMMHKLGAENVGLVPIDVPVFCAAFDEVNYAEAAFRAAGVARRVYVLDYAAPVAVPKAGLFVMDRGMNGLPLHYEDRDDAVASFSACSEVFMINYEQVVPADALGAVRAQMIGARLKPSVATCDVAQTLAWLKSHYGAGTVTSGLRAPCEKPCLTGWFGSGHALKSWDLGGAQSVTSACADGAHPPDWAASGFVQKLRHIKPPVVRDDESSHWFGHSAWDALAAEFFPDGAPRFSLDRFLAEPRMVQAGFCVGPVVDELVYNCGMEIPLATRQKFGIGDALGASGRKLVGSLVFESWLHEFEACLDSTTAVQMLADPLLFREALVTAVSDVHSQAPDDEVRMYLVGKYGRSGVDRHDALVQSVMFRSAASYGFDLMRFIQRHGDVWDLHGPQAALFGSALFDMALVAQSLSHSSSGARLFSAFMPEGFLMASCGVLEAGAFRTVCVDADVSQDIVVSTDWRRAIDHAVSGQMTWGFAGGEFFSIFSVGGDTKRDEERFSFEPDFSDALSCSALADS